MYTAEFIKKLREVYPTEYNLHTMVQNNEYFLGRYLDDMSQGSISTETILSSTSLEELQQKAKVLKAKKELYTMWTKQPK